ncbi:VOC family protein [Neogemmobacter tilapiae]|uniref:Glyoxalase n=1 Tax=Neogemmobacter tilapiae TaxID=875041 RepID=A0A918WIU4_9RHOB|nr:VOC family protein [Gemmobacter tilapiae]GHC55704.1 glyoxalase [Gemmobacter tilapiae]
MAKATGIGGIFFRAADPEALAHWYHRHLGIDMTQGTWHQQSGPTVFAPFRANTDYFPPDRQHMINLRVDDLQTLIAQLTAAQIPVETRPEWDADPQIGQFARIHDPEGNPIELWQPPT